MQGLRMLAGYTGTNTQGATNTMTIGTNHATFTAGTFVGSTNITIDSYFTLNGAAFTAPSGTLLVNRKFEISAGFGASFIHNSGTVEFGKGSLTAGWDTKDEASVVKSSGAVFNNVSFAATGNYTRSVVDDMDVRGNLYHSNYSFINAVKPDLTAFATSTITLKGNFIVYGAGTFGIWGRLNVLMTGAVDQVVSQTTANCGSCLMIAKPSGIVKAASHVQFYGLYIAA
ncbi:MAG: hypothetical protein Q8O57_12575, partial [Kiritimatiellota bacterium]|nr:hypothetical protein [Kiritimatiellota bacterium]